MKVKNKYSGRTLTLKDDEWEVVKEPEPECVKELSSKITETVLARIEEYLPKSNKGMSFFKYYEMTKEEVNKTLDWLNGKFVDPYVEVPAVNALLNILGYVDLFIYDNDNDKVYHFNMVEERMKNESNK